ASAAVSADPVIRSVRSALSRCMCASTSPGVTSRPPTSTVSRAGSPARPTATIRPPAIARSTGPARSGRRPPPKIRSSTALAPPAHAGSAGGRGRVPAAQDLEPEQREPRQHGQRAERKQQSADGLSGLKEAEPPEDVAPVVDQPLGQ